MNRQKREKLCGIGFIEQAAARLYAANESDVLAATLAYVEMRMKKGGVESPVALSRDALRKGYGVEEGAKALAKAKTAGKKASSKTASTPTSQQAKNRAWILPRPPNAHASTLMPCLRMTSSMSFASYRAPWLKDR